MTADALPRLLGATRSGSTANNGARTTARPTWKVIQSATSRGKLLVNDMVVAAMARTTPLLAIHGLRLPRRERVRSDSVPMTIVAIMLASEPVVARVP